MYVVCHSGSYMRPFLLQFLPVYYPSPEEVKDVALFARNVRAKMAE